MPLAQPISSLRQELNKLLANDDLPAGLKLCKELLPEGGEKLKLTLAMQAQLQQLNKDRMKGMISQEEYARRLAIIVDSFINFVAELETADFDPPAIAAPTSASNSPQTGSVLYRVPHSMPLQKASICTIRVAIDEDAILEDIIIDADVRLKEKVEVSERMSAELLDTEGRVFDILPLNAKDQKVRPTGYTQWLFRVTPLVEGEHQLLVKVSLLEFDQNTKEYVPRDVSVLETVTVVTASQHSDEEDATLKSAGQSFVVGPDATPDFNMKKDTVNVESENPSGSNWLNGRIQRIAALFLAFLVFASATTYAFTPKMTRDWWATTWRDTPEAYQAFIDAHKDDAPGGIKHPKIEKAYFYKAFESNKLSDLREYQILYPTSGRFKDQILKKIDTLERQTVRSIQKKPTALKIERYLVDFPDANLWLEVWDAMRNMPSDEKQALLPKIGKQLRTQEQLNSSSQTKEQESTLSTITSDKNHVSITNKAETKSNTNPSIDNKIAEPINEVNSIKEKTEEKQIAINHANDPFRSQLVRVKGGTFQMGSPETDKDATTDERPQHSVTLSDFYISKYEVTQAQWREVIGDNPSSFEGCDQCPVENVSWNDIQEFLKILNAKTGNKYRLPTEAEWEYAATGGSQNKLRYRYAGSNTLEEVAWYANNSSIKTHPVGQKKANELGLYDMSGNVWEWCQDWFGLYSSQMQTNPKGANSGYERVFRGGSWNYGAIRSRVHYRSKGIPSSFDFIIGFRIAL